MRHYAPNDRRRGTGCADLAVVEITEIRAALAPRQRLMGLDVGRKTVGLAMSDPALVLASPLSTLIRGKFAADAENLKRVAAAENVGGLIVGLPVEMSGREGPRCQSVRQFGENLLGVIDLPLAYWDERLSTAAVERVLIDEADMSRQRRKQVVDKMAAAYILQGALDALSRT
jgi:putative Holliday junction resolvase